MNIVHISTSVIGGGAAIAAFRLHQSLMKEKDVNSSILQRFPIEEDFAKNNHIQTAYTNRDLITRIRKKYNLHTEHFHWANLNKYPADYEIATFATTSYRLEKLPIVQNADIIHLHWVAEFLNYPTFFKNIKQPIVWTLHDINPFRGMFHFDSDKAKNESIFGDLDNKTLETKIKAINKKNDISVVCLSEWMKKKSECSLTLGRYPHYIIPNGLDFSKYPVIEKKHIKEKLNINNGLKTIIIVGASLENKQKGFPLLFEAINSLKRNDFNFITIGHLHNPDIINSGINHIHINNISDIEKLNSYYSAADLTIIPSKEDNLPNIMLESFANGTPVMSFTNGGMAEHIKTGENGILVNQIGVEPLASGINDFLNNKYIFDNEKIRNYAIINFSDTLQTKRYIQLYKDILNK